MARKKLTDEQVNTIKEQYAEGVAVVDIALHLGIHETTVHSYLRRLNLKRQPDRVRNLAARRLTDDEIVQILYLYEEGYLIAEIAHEVNCSIPTVHTHIRRAGLSRQVDKRTMILAVQLHVEDGLPVTKVLDRFQIPRATFYRYLKKYKVEQKQEG